MTDTKAPLRKAPKFRVPYWIDGNGEERSALKLAELGSGYKVIYCFQAACPGCYSSRFSNLQRLVAALSDKRFGFAVVQIAFEDFSHNTQDRIREMQLRYDLKIPFGHDLKQGEFYPSIMEDYRTGGTPFYLIIDPDGNIAFSEFHIDTDKFLEAFQ